MSREEDNRHNEKKQNGKRQAGGLTARLLAFVFLIAFAVCAVIIIADLVNKENAAENMQSLQQEASLDEPSETAQVSLAEQLGIDIPEKELDFARLKETNSDIYAWIYVPGTAIDYPVLQHPADDTFYLEHNIDKSSGLPGCIYSELINGTSFNDRNTVLYGHNMLNGTMFATLHRYEDSEFFDENRYIFIYTDKGVYVYEIFAAYTYSDIHLLKGIDITSEEKFGDYLEEALSVRGMSDNIEPGLGVNGRDRIITLSTCTSDDSKRYLVQGVLLNGRDERQQQQQ